MGRIIVPGIVVRPLLPPQGPKIGVRVQPQYLHWQVGRYRERLTSGPGGLGKEKVWVPEREGEQHNLILDRFYNQLIPTHGLVTPSQYAAVGTGSATPDPTQTGLQNEVARTNFVPTDEANQIIAMPDYGVYDVRRVAEFTEAQVGGRNLTEWGFGPTSASGSGTMNRELFRDGNGTPVVLTLDTDQRLRLIYRYRITLGPTVVQDITINVGGDGPGPRTAKFILTAGGLTIDNFGGGVTSYSGGRNNYDLYVVNNLVQGVSVNNALLSSAVPLTYIHTSNPGGGVFKSLSYDTPVNNSRRAHVLFLSNEGNLTVKSCYLAGPTANIVFDNGQEIAKDNLHKLFIGYWVITWGP